MAAGQQCCLSAMPGIVSMGAMDFLAQAIADLTRVVTFQARREEPRANGADHSQDTTSQPDKPLVSKHARRAMPARPDES